MKRLLSQIIAAGLGLWLATICVSRVVVRLYANSNFFGFHITALWELFVLLAIILGLLNYFVKPILNTIALPLRIITLGLFSFIINMGLIWVLDYIFKEFSAPFFYPLFWTTLIVWGINMLLSNSILKNND